MNDLMGLMRSVNDATLAASQEARRSLVREIMGAINRPRNISDPQWLAAAIVEDVRRICEKNS